MDSFLKDFPRKASGYDWLFEVKASPCSTCIFYGIVRIGEVELEISGLAYRGRPRIAFDSENKAPQMFARMSAEKVRAIAFES